MHLHHLFLLLLTTSLHLLTSAAALGINYGTLGDNLPPPTEVANFIKTKTIFDSVKIFDTNPDIIKAFANTNISMTVTVGNGEVPALADLKNARRWVDDNIKPFVPQTNIKYISIGNEIVLSNNPDWINNLVPALRSLNNALVKAGLKDVKVTTAHALNIFDGIVTFPSAARFRPDLAQSFYLPLLQYHRRTQSPFMINPYSYFKVAPQTLEYAVFRPCKPLVDAGKIYTNMFDELLDSTHSAMNALGFGDVEIVIGETGWPSAGDPNNPGFATMMNAVSYNTGLIKEILAGKGTPLMPNRRFETYIFALFNENQKPGPIPEKNWGLFWPSFAPVYDSGVLRDGQQQPGPTTTPSNPAPATGTAAPAGPAPTGGKQFCVPKQDASDAQLQSNIDWACGQQIDCAPIGQGGVCAEPNNVRAHAAFVMNSYYRTKGQSPNECNFSGTGEITTVDPSNGNCRFL